MFFRQAISPIDIIGHWIYLVISYVVNISSLISWLVIPRSCGLAKLDAIKLVENRRCLRLRSLTLIIHMGIKPTKMLTLSLLGKWWRLLDESRTWLIIVWALLTIDWLAPVCCILIRGRLICLYFASIIKILWFLSE